MNRLGPHPFAPVTMIEPEKSALELSFRKLGSTAGKVLPATMKHISSGPMNMVIGDMLMPPSTISQEEESAMLRDALRRYKGTK